MTSSASPSSASVSRLQRQVRAQQEEIARLHQLMEKKEAEWEAAKAALFEQFRLAIERQFGPSTEKYRVTQGDLLINEAEAAVDEEQASAQDDAADDGVDATAEPRQPAKRRSRGGRVALPPELPRVEVIHVSVPMLKVP
ncbi:transposase [Halomonas sp. 11-S5]|uniref:transposase n=1 Tax=Halomonas sp. 11-S5 TaxID=2994064 RepID=UPI002469BE31|nr:transposase [Halomonas sp. 11-S5]